MGRKRKNDYIDNDVLLVLVLEYREQHKVCVVGTRPKMSEPLGQSLLLIAERLASKPNFARYTYKEDMIGDAIENVILYLHKFNPEKSKNPFSYITEIMFWAFVRRIQKEKKHADIKDWAFKQAIVSGLFTHENTKEDFLSNMQNHVDHYE